MDSSKVETTCSSMHCYNRAEITPVMVDNQWWVTIPNPVPFCEKCMAKEFPDLNRKVHGNEPATAN